MASVGQAFRPDVLNGGLESLIYFIATTINCPKITKLR
jgi:hypothetical protein